MDITMCRTQSCPRKSTCLRYIAKPGELQSYFVDKTWEDCVHYWKTKEGQR